MGYGCTSNEASGIVNSNKVCNRLLSNDTVRRTVYAESTHTQPYNSSTRYIDNVYRHQVYDNADAIINSSTSSSVNYTCLYKAAIVFHQR